MPSAEDTADPEHVHFQHWSRRLADIQAISRYELEALASERERWPVSTRALVVQLLSGDLLAPDDVDWLEACLGNDYWIREQFAAYRILNGELIDWRPVLLQLGASRVNWAAYRAIDLVPDDALQAARELLQTLATPRPGLLKALNRRSEDLRSRGHHR